MNMQIVELHIFVCISLCTTVVDNTVQSSYWQGTPSSEALEFKNFEGPLQGLFDDISKSVKNIYKTAVAIRPSRRKQVINWMAMLQKFTVALVNRPIMQ